MANLIHISKKVLLRTEQAAYSDNAYYTVPFTVTAETVKEGNLWSRLQNAISKKFPPSHFGGCGSSWSVSNITMDTETTGHFELKHYAGIGD
jgi:hypothetical protein